MKKGIFSIAAAALTAMLLTGCAAGKEKITLVVKTPPLYADNRSEDGRCPTYDFLEKAGKEFSGQYKKADVSFRVEQFEYVDELSMITGCFGTPDAPDVLMAGYFNMSSYIYGGNVVPLDDIISPGLEKDFNKGDLAVSRINGKTYMLPFYSLYNTICYNKELFRSCGLDRYIGEGMEIKNWSLDDWEIILSELKEKLPEGVYPMSMYAKNNQGDTHTMVLIRSRGCSFFDKSGYFDINNEKGIAGLRWIKDCYDKGYYPPGCENLETQDCTKLFSSGKLAIYITNSTTMPRDMDIGLANFPSNGKRGMSTAFTTGFMVFDNGDNAKLEAAKDFISFIYSKDDLLDYEREAIPANRSVSARSKDIIVNLDNYIANSDTIVNFTANNPNWQGSENCVREVFWKHIHSLLTGEETPEQCAAAVEKECNAAIKEGRTAGNLHE